jgi:hypothetical protein
MSHHLSNRVLPVLAGRGLGGLPALSPETLPIQITAER